ncbi:hypothetical protein [Nocardioides aestuarii]|uniref:LamG domain-containing protein n=1 Tax=Nocardioides aestuarii TaxID=252231 RepID=A0ABW4TNN6_9ACTN
MLRRTAAAVSFLVLAAAPAAGAAPQVVDTWSYSPATHQLVAAGSGAPFSIVGGSAFVDTSGAAAVQFTAAPGVAVQTAEPFVAPGGSDFRYEAVMGVDRLRASSTPNVFQYGRYDGHQVKLQLSAKGVPQCLFNGTGGRLKLTSRSPSLGDGGRQHTFACWRTGGSVGVTVDGTTTSRLFALGSVTPVGKATAGNRSPTGKASDQLFGKIWSVSVSLG